MVHHLIDHLPIPETQLHLGRMDVDIQKFRLNRKLEHGKRVFVLHHKGLVGILYRLVDKAAFDIPAIGKIVFIIAVAPGNQRFPDITFHLHRIRPRLHRKQICRNLPAEYGVNNIFQVMVAGGMELALPVLDKPDGNLGM